MKLLGLVAASIAATGLATQESPKINAKCEGSGDDEKLQIQIPYADKRTAQLLKLEMESGECDQSNYDGEFSWSDESGNGMIHLNIPIDKCKLRGELYGAPLTKARSYGLYRPTVTVTLGEKVKGKDMIFRSLPIAAECGSKTSYTVEFEYDGVKSADTTECQMVGDTCVFPAYDEEFKFEIKEYTDDSFNTPAEAENRANTAGQMIYLSVAGTSLPDDTKFAVTECKVKDGEHEMVIMNPGAETDGTCEFEHIDFKATYVQEQNRFNFQHKLFLLQTMLNGESNFKLICTVEVCAKNALDSKCNKAAGVCIDELEEEDKSVAQESYFCDSACDADSEKCEYSDGVVQCVEKNLQKCACNSKTQTCDEECESGNVQIEGCADGWIYKSVGGVAHCVKACACNSKIQTCGEECESGNIEMGAGCAEGWKSSTFDSGDDSVGWISHCVEKLQPCACNTLEMDCGEECESINIDMGAGCAEGWETSYDGRYHCVEKLQPCACNTLEMDCGEECESDNIGEHGCAEGWSRFINSISMFEWSYVCHKPY